MRKIALTKNQTAYVSDEDYFDLLQYRWQARWNGFMYYAVRNIKQGVNIYMHRQIAEKMGLDLSEQIDHIDGNGLNNQRENLRSATSSQNGFNRNKQNNNTSGFKGVFFDKRRSNYFAQIRINGKSIRLGTFDDINEAVKAYQEAAKKYRGEFAR